MGGIFETVQYDHAVTGLQFDTRKIIAAAGDNGVKVRITYLQMTLVLINLSHRYITVRVCSSRRFSQMGIQNP